MWLPEKVELIIHETITHQSVVPVGVVLCYEHNNQL